MRETDIYPDLAIDLGDVPPSCIAARARAMASVHPVQWTPDTTEPSDVLAVIGAIVLGYARRAAVSWDGEALRGGDLISPLLGLEYGHGKVRGIARVFLRDQNGEKIWLAREQDAPCLWAGHVTDIKIWGDNLASLAALYDLSVEAPDDDDIIPVGMATKIDNVACDCLPSELWSPSVTGYDASVTSDTLRDGFSLSVHPEIVVVGARPAVELYSLIGGAYLGDVRRWLTCSYPHIPAIAGIPLRGQGDLDRLCAISNLDMAVRCEMHGKRGILRAL